MCLATSALGTCASKSEPCYFDARCARPWIDPYGGLGCHAGGHIGCRFCGFGGFKGIPCPTGTTGAKQATIILQGLVESIGPPGSEERERWRDAFKTQLAFLMDIDEIRIMILDMRAASLMIEILVLPGTQTTAQTSDSAIARLQDAIAATDQPPPAIGGMPLAAVDVREAPPAPPFSPEALLLSSSAFMDMTVSALSSDETGAGSGRWSEVPAGIATGSGSVVVLTLFACLLRSHIRRRRRLATANQKGEHTLPSTGLPLPMPMPMPMMPPPRPFPAALSRLSASQKLGEGGFLPWAKCDSRASRSSVGVNARPVAVLRKSFANDTSARTTIPVRTNSYLEKWVNSHRGSDESSARPPSLEVLQGQYAPEGSSDEPVYMGTVRSARVQDREINVSQLIDRFRTNLFEAVGGRQEASAPTTTGSSRTSGEPSLPLNEGSGDGVSERVRVRI